ncbi:MAG: hypothetical protein JST92_04815 [Deltaproteobacteria bacterium]|nr:hypothetical protein [Deltaproteobacteria bacterium]
MSLESLAKQTLLGPLLEALTREYGGYRLLDHWQQGEFHHDLVVQVTDTKDLPGPVLVASTNCNAGLKELLCFAAPPTKGALWHARCPANPAFMGDLPPLLGSVKTSQWFDPCEVLSETSRSEIRAEFRERDEGGGWRLKGEACGVPRKA